MNSERSFTTTVEVIHISTSDEQGDNAYTSRILMVPANAQRVEASTLQA